MLRAQTKELLHKISTNLKNVYVYQFLRAYINWLLLNDYFCKSDRNICFTHISSYKLSKNIYLARI